MMGIFNVIAGDFEEGNAHQLVRKNLLMKTSGRLFREKIPVSQIAELSVASEESVNRIGGAIGWGLAGEALLGPVGLLAGVLRGGRGRDVTFVCRLNDGRRFLGTAPSKIYSIMQQAALKSAYYRTDWKAPTSELSSGERAALPSENPNHPGHSLRQISPPRYRQKWSLKKRLIVSISLFLLIIVCLGVVSVGMVPQASSPPTPLNVSISIVKTGGYLPVINGKTNLPDGLKLIVSINRTNGAELGGQDVIVANGQFQTGPFSIGDHGYRPGKYIAEITSSLASIQSPDVQAVIGNEGQFMNGPSVVKAEISPSDKVIDDSVPFRVP